MLAEQVTALAGVVDHLYGSLYWFHDSQADLDRHPAKPQQHITVLGSGIFTHYCMITRLLTAVGGFGSTAVSLKDIHHLNDPITSSARYLK